MFTILACLFVLFAIDGVFRGRTLNDDGAVAEGDDGAGSKRLRRVRSVLWGVLALICLFIASQFEW
jgi:hypothetical protein